MENCINCGNMGLMKTAMALAMDRRKEIVERCFCCNG